MKRSITNDWQAIERPARYSGNEWNIIRKDGPVLCRLLLAFPNTYEIGMSHLGLRLLYDQINQHDDLALERIFAPWPDMEEEIRAGNHPFNSLETERDPASFDMLGFTLQTELDFTNVLTMLDLAEIPLRAAERQQEHPLVIGGGPVAFNPEPIAPFFDLFLIGDGEEALPRLMRLAGSMRKHGADRYDILHCSEEIQGVYAPALHETEIDSESGLEVVAGSNSPDEPLVIKAMVENLDDYPFPEKMLVPYCDIVHDRAAVEIGRGCSRGCRFCQAGVIYMPERRRSAESVLNSVSGLLNSTGYQDVSISALTPNDHPELDGMLDTMIEQFDGDGITISLASLSPSNVDEEMLRKVGGVRKTGITIAPEAGSQRLRDVINKGITEEQILKTAATAFKLGWRKVKLYFMIGLPTETDEDVLAIAELARAVADLQKGVTVKIGCSNFVPKSHTPFQWVAMNSKEEFERKQSLLFNAVKGDRRISFTSHDVDDSVLEGVFSRGDRRIAEAIERAWELGCRFDGWADQLRMDFWKQAFEETGIDPWWYTQRTLPPFARMPWSHVSPGVSAAFQRKEYQLALAGESSVRCAPANCSICRACPPEMLKSKWGTKPEAASEQRYTMPSVSISSEEEAHKYRLRFHKGSELGFLGHLDLARLVARVFRRAKIAVKMSEGFNPQPRISFALALPLGQEGRNEYCDAILHYTDSAEELLQRLNEQCPDGLRFTSARLLEAGSKSLSAELAAAEYVVRKADGSAFDYQLLQRFMQQQSLEWTRFHKGKHKRFDIRGQVLAIENRNARGELRLQLQIVPGVKARPAEVMKAALGTDADDLVIWREQLYIDREGQLLPPL